MASKLNRRQEIYVDWSLDLLLYIVILNLFAEYSDAFYFETFTVTILTAIVLKAFLILIMSLEHRVTSYYKKKEGKIYKYLNIISAFLILFLSKFVILEAIDIIFRHRVDIYGFIPLVVLIITMIAARKLMEFVYKNL